MTDSLFLQRVELSNFRVYGEDFSLTLPEGPGVTLLSGPNGMGKTTFFDALEWGLTGEIKRFNDYLTKRSRAEHLTRFGTPDGSHRVSLYFNGGAPVDRTSEYNVPAGEIAALLKAPSWPEISDLYSYLSITHFLGQSSGQRFSLKKPSEQWQTLRGPAGVDRLNWAKERIGSHATRMAFNRAIKEYTVELELAVSELEEWRTLLSRRTTAKRLTSVRSLSPDEIFKGIEDIEKDLIVIATGTQAVRSTSADAPSRLDGMRERLTRLAEASSSRITELFSLEALPAELLSLTKDLAAIRTKVQVAGQDLADRKSRLAEKNEALKRQEGVQTTLDGDLQKLRLDQETLVSLRNAQETVTEADSNIHTLQIQFAEIDSSIADYRKDRESLRSEEAGRAALLTRREELTANLGNCRNAAVLFQQFQAARNDLADFTDLHKDDSSMAQLRSLLESAEADFARTAQLTTDARRQMESLQTREAVIDAAVSVIFAHLRTDDIECPVCKSRFEEGVLRAAGQVDRAQSPDAKRLSERINQLQKDSEEATLRVAKARRDLESQSRLDRTARDKKEQVSTLAADLARLNVETQIPDVTAVALESRVEELESKLQEIELGLASLVDPHEIATKIDGIDGSLTVATSKLGSIRLELERLQARRAAAAVSLKRHNRRLEDEGLDPSRWKDYLSTTMTNMNLKAQDLADAMLVIEPLRREVDMLGRALEESESRQFALIEDQKRAQIRLRNLEDRWTETGLSLPLDTSSLLDAREAETARKQSIEGLITRLGALLEGYRAWLEDRDIKLVTEEISLKVKRVSASSEEEMEARLAGGVEAASKKLQRATTVRELSEQIVHSLQTKADAYSQHVLRPLNTCIRQFSRALMTRADDSVTYRAEHYANRSELRPEINLRKELGGETSIEMNPNLYFSEGQLAALSISALFAASTCFRWSRWKALLLDDPLQHSDVIHASAFVDVITNLVKELGYQVIISTHDETEFEYMVNKFRSSSIPLSLCELRVKGSIGPVGSFVQRETLGNM